MKAFDLYVLAYVGAGRNCLFNENIEGALFYLNKGLEIYPDNTAYAYAIQAYLINGNHSKAKEILDNAKKRIYNKNQLIR